MAQSTNGPRCNRPCQLSATRTVSVQAYGFVSVSTDDITQFIGRLLQLGEFGLVKLVYSAGVDASPHHYQQLVTGASDAVAHDQLDSSMLEYIDRLLHNPRRLKDLCRRKIRRLLSSNVLSRVGQLDVGDYDKDYLCIMDTDHYTGLWQLRLHCDQFSEKCNLSPDMNE